MTDEHPERRPTAEEALREWVEVREQIPAIDREWRPRPREEHFVETTARDAISLYEISMNFARVDRKSVV